MMRRRSRLPVLNQQNLESKATDETCIVAVSQGHRSLIFDCIRFLIYCTLLIIPVYAIIRSAIDHNWVMMVIDILLIPVGFIHGVLLLSGIVG